MSRHKIPNKNSSQMSSLGKDSTCGWYNSCFLSLTCLLRPSVGVWPPRSPPFQYLVAAVSLLCPSGQLLTRCVGELDKCGWELDSREQLQTNTLFPECQRAFWWWQTQCASFSHLECGWAFALYLTLPLPPCQHTLSLKIMRTFTHFKHFSVPYSRMVDLSTLTCA